MITKLQPQAEQSTSQQTEQSTSKQAEQSTLYQTEQQSATQQTELEFEYDELVPTPPPLPPPLGQEETQQNDTGDINANADIISDTVITCRNPRHTESNDFTHVANTSNSSTLNTSATSDIGNTSGTSDTNESASMLKYIQLSDLTYIYNNSSSRRNFANNCAKKIFTIEERLNSNVNGKKGKQGFDTEKIAAIYNTVFQFYPLAGGEDRKRAWSDCVRAIDESSRKIKFNFSRKIHNLKCIHALQSM